MVGNPFESMFFFFATSKFFSLLKLGVSQTLRWCNGLLGEAKTTPVLRVGSATCLASLAWPSIKGTWRISNGSTTAPLPERTNFVACHPAVAVAKNPAMIALRGTSCMPRFGLAAMATIVALDACHPNRPWDTRVNIGPPLWSMALKRCTSLPLVTGVAWMDPWIPTRAVLTSWPMTGENVLDPVSSQGVGGTRHTPCSSVITSSWCSVSTHVANPLAFRSVAMYQAERSVRKLVFEHLLAHLLAKRFGLVVLSFLLLWLWSLMI